MRSDLVDWDAVRTVSLPAPHTGAGRLRQELAADADQPQQDDEAERHTQKPQNNVGHDRAPFYVGQP